MGDNLQGGDHQSIRNCFEEVINYLPFKPLRCLDLGSGICFAFEKLLFKNRGGVIVDCVDRYPPDLLTELPDNVKYIQGSVEEPLVFEEKYDCIFCLEVIEHIDYTDMLIHNCYNNLKEDGLLFLAFPNLASLYSRLELLMGYQPHILEVSNEYANYGGGVFGRMNNPTGEPVHHIRGITYKAMKDFLRANHFRIDKVRGCGRGGLLRMCPPISSVALMICTKTPIEQAGTKK